MQRGGRTQTGEPALDLGDRRIPVDVSVNRRARRLILRVDPVAGRLLITVPSKRAAPDALAFARERRDWIAAQLTEDAAGRPFADGAVVPYRGAPHRIVNEGGPRAPVRAGVHDGAAVIFVGGEAAHLNRRLTDWLRSEARRLFSERVAAHSAAIGVRPSRISIRDTRSRWGSCNSERALSFSWRLVLAPPFVLDYVAAHECAHLVHLNHSPAYWRLVRSLGVRTKEAEAWLDREGVSLHRWGAPG